MKIIKLLLGASILLLVSGQVSAAVILDIDSDGILLGASNIPVDGSFYDVSFQDGTCASVFDGCDNLSDFTFQSFPEAELAGEALLSLVFIDNPLGDFDSDTELTNGCTVFAPNTCEVFTPYGFSPSPGNAFFTVLNNFSSASGLESEDNIGQTALEIDVIPAGGSPRGSTNTFARWTVSPDPCSEFPGGGATEGCFPGPGEFPGGGASVVPVPAAVWLFGTALIGLVGFSKRRKTA